MQDTDPIPASRRAHLTDSLRLQGAVGVGPRTAHLLLQAYGAPRAVFEASFAALSGLVGAARARSLLAPPTAATQALIATTLAWCRVPGQQVLVQGDASYPPLLAAIPDPPLLLYIKGRAALLAQPACAIVGSRNATAQGRANAAAFAAALAGAGVCVVSGLALGIDAAAHEGALGASGATIAVLGSGADLVYPVRNRLLAERIAGQGCIVSEYPPGTPPLASNFPRRNRIISGLAAGVLVVEAAAQSGSLITARMAAEQGREVFALPGSIHAPLAKGCHQLIRDGARLLETSAELLEALRVSPLVGLAAAVPSAAATAPLPTVADCTAVLAELGHAPLALDTLQERSGVSIGDLSISLLALEMAGLIERLPGGKVQRVTVE